MIRLAIFASGSGSNAESIIEYFKEKNEISVELILSNNPEAYVIQRAKNHKIDYRIFHKDEFRGDAIIDLLNDYRVDMLVLAGFLWLIPEKYIQKYPIINIHPALLPKYGGKGLYGMRVHRAVKEAGESESGMTIHKVNQNYDEGSIIYQESCPLDPTDTPEDIAAKVLVLEHKNYPRVIEEYAFELIGNS